MQDSCKLAAQVLEYAGTLFKVGIFLSSPKDFHFGWYILVLYLYQSYELKSKRMDPIEPDLHTYNSLPYCHLDLFFHKFNVPSNPAKPEIQLNNQARNL
jgi:hypothetical protein